MRRKALFVSPFITCDCRDFRFAYVGFAALWGLFFAEVLDLLTLTGMALIILAGVLGGEALSLFKRWKLTASIVLASSAAHQTPISL